MKYRKTSERRNVASEDVTWKELGELGKKKGLVGSTLEFLHSFWVGDHPEREESVRVGSVAVDVDQDGFLHLDFTTRFRLNEEDRSCLLEQIQRGQQQVARDWLNKLNKKGVQ